MAHELRPGMIGCIDDVWPVGVPAREEEGEVMKEGTVSFHGRPILTHAVTAAASVTLFVLLTGGELRVGRLPLTRVAEGPRQAVTIAPEAPAPQGPASQRPNFEHAPPPPEDVLKDLEPDERNNVRIYAASNKGVVNITTEAEVSGFFGDSTSTGTGSGFVIDKQGHIMTSFHVVQDADQLRVTLFDGSVHEARVKGTDASNDVAVLSIAVPSEKLFPLTIGDSSTVMVGQKILALGNPFGLERTLTTGIVSSLERSLKAKNARIIKGIIQTDAAINPGNSGGPLLNSKGHVIGMNTAIVSQVGQSAGISFAVPINPISRILQQLIANGRVIRADLGITRVYATGDGLLVIAMVEGGPADRAGIQPVRVRVERLAPGVIRRRLDPDSADLIVAIEHKRVRTVDELLTEVEKLRPGDIVRVTVVRDDKPIDVRVRLGQS
jgi:S1-C subfamily serine protease